MRSDVPSALADLIDAVLAHYARRGHGNPTMLVHAAIAEEVLQQALRHGGEHVIKLADTALDAYATSADELALAAVLTAIDLDA